MSLPETDPWTGQVGRLLIHPPGGGAWNMAVDEVLLENAARGQLSLRFYQWQEATVSLGYFQALSERNAHPASLACPLVRRSSGGGAIVHDGLGHDLTYSLAVPGVPRRGDEQARLYAVLHEALIDALSDFGVAATSCPEHRLPPRTKPFLCFQRQTPGDVLLEDQKILGSAQRRNLMALLQHGSVLLQQSPFVPELPGIGELRGRKLDVEPLREVWQSRLWDRWPVTWQRAELTKPEIARAEELVAQKYGNPRWNARR